ncbi:Uncharacterized protein AO441_001660 [Nakaseomyces glabratus]|uniref:LSO1/LSO2 domain-containing protein n=1 Tax=Candida glabrata TaxID=5478 RepID=A0A0W0C8R3_CANGB|nr:Uncharacterized protein AO441_001660 [Nakaseomyces glabratus]KTB07143.1 Uncharacterized protein AO440_001764 [Nakaseomyces glabratus]
MGKRFSESAAKVAQGRARKRQQEWEKNRAQKEHLEAMEAKKWEEGAREGTSKKALLEEKRQQKLAAKKERDALLKAEEKAIGRGGKLRNL